MKTMNNLAKKMMNGNYAIVYNKLKQTNYAYSLDVFTRDFVSVKSINKYCYLLYVMAKEESPKIHILICDVLMYTDTFFDDIYSVIYWHISQALKIDPYNIEAMSWAIDVFYRHPDSPFSKIELYTFACHVNSQKSNDKRALEIINDYKGD